MKRIQLIILALITLFLLTPAVTEASKLDDVKYFVETYYYGDIPKTLHSMKTVDEVINALDEYSRYLTREEYVTYIAAVGEAPVSHVANANPEITSHMMYGNTGYIKIPTFPANLGKEVTAHWNKLKKAGATELIIDLRYNGGGYVDSAEQLLGFFKGATNAYQLKTRDGSRLFKPVQSTVKFPQQTYVLVNRYSASASEIVAVALKDQDASVIVGETTKGKGSIQSFFEFDDGSALKLTTGHFTGPKGTVVHKKGVIPTIKTSPGQELFTMHQRLLNTRFANQNYKQVPSPQLVPMNKTFHLHFTQPMNFSGSQTSTKVDLVKLGGVAVPITTKPNGKDTLDIIPKKHLQPGGSYVLVIHPGMQNDKGRTVKQGTYTPITVQPVK
ncbi:carboxy-terminal processing protease [Bacillus sp. OxB-1]|uniref:S41 family peptidase n=1 Tax=Bacillus sp. (strain OxB-1) TaxID=98228 RepID=UPI00058238F3|nr:S41 family peptidase [Bacillus sp. OxB-1]BAQ09950.1 carboxy-terminal processing protease [Bacillus sp. OxB-1]